MQRGSGRLAGVCALALVFLFADIVSARSDDLDAAVTELKREYAEHAKQPGSNSLRTSCDYFKGKSVGITPKDVLDVLERPLPGMGSRARSRDGVRQTAYVKWQLLSILPETIDAGKDPETLARLLKVYEHAPVPAARYTCSKHEQRQLDTLLEDARPQDDVKLTEQLEEAVKRGFDADVPVIAYRDELYRRLPAGRDKFVAALRDAHTRVMLAAPKDKLVEALSTDLPRWAISSPDDERDGVRAVAELLGKLRFVESAPYYASADVRRGKLTWVTDTDTLLTKKKFADLHKTLLDAAGATPPTVDAATTGKDNKKTRKTGNDS